MILRLPNHIGLIPDGNRRWAANRGLAKQQGYDHGLEPGLQALRLAKQYHIPELTFYGFTTDNCKRPQAQKTAFTQACVDAVRLIAAEGVSLLVVGNTASPCFPQELLPFTKRTDMNGGGIKVNFLVNYGWEWDLSNIHEGTANRKKINDMLFSKDISRVDLVIRWGGMRRLSGFLPIQAVYSDFYVVDDLWPDFCPQHFTDALQWYGHQDVTLGG